MFSLSQKKQIAAKIEEVLLSFNHPELPKEKPMFKIRIDGKENWLWADIEPNWKYENVESGINPWNEVTRLKMESERKNPQFPTKRPSPSMN